MPKWLTKALKWAGKTLINAAREEVEKIIEEKKNAKRVPIARPRTSNES
jgi:hypothetical protein